MSVFSNETRAVIDSIILPQLNEWNQSRRDNFGIKGELIEDLQKLKGLQQPHWPTECLGNPQKPWMPLHMCHSTLDFNIKHLVSTIPILPTTQIIPLPWIVNSAREYTVASNLEGRIACINYNSNSHILYSSEPYQASSPFEYVDTVRPTQWTPICDSMKSITVWPACHPFKILPGTSFCVLFLLKDKEYVPEHDCRQRLVSSHTFDLGILSHACYFTASSIPSCFLKKKSAKLHLLLPRTPDNAPPTTTENVSHTTKDIKPLSSLPSEAPSSKNETITTMDYKEWWRLTRSQVFAWPKFAGNEVALHSCMLQCVYNNDLREWKLHETHIDNGTIVFQVAK